MKSKIDNAQVPPVGETTMINVDCDVPNDVLSQEKPAAMSYEDRLNLKLKSASQARNVHVEMLDSRMKSKIDNAQEPPVRETTIINVDCDVPNDMLSQDKPTAISHEERLRLKLKSASQARNEHVETIDSRMKSKVDNAQEPPVRETTITNVDCDVSADMLSQDKPAAISHEDRLSLKLKSASQARNEHEEIIDSRMKSKVNNSQVTMTNVDCDVFTDVQYRVESEPVDGSNTKLKENMALLSHRDKLDTERKAEINTKILPRPSRSTIQSKIRDLESMNDPTLQNLNTISETSELSESRPTANSVHLHPNLLSKIAIITGDLASQPLASQPLISQPQDPPNRRHDLFQTRSTFSFDSKKSSFGPQESFDEEYDDNESEFPSAPVAVLVKTQDVVESLTEAVKYDKPLINKRNRNIMIIVLVVIIALGLGLGLGLGLTNNDSSISTTNSTAYNPIFRDCLKGVLEENSANIDKIKDPETSYGKAIRWLNSTDTYTIDLCIQNSLSNNTTILLQRFIIVLFYFEMSGDLEQHDLRNMGWLNYTNECDWAGISCNNNNNLVDKLNITSQKLKGTISTEISKLERLEVFKLGGNMITGSIPSELGTLNLTELFLNNNTLTGNIPSELFFMDSLKYLNLGNNDLSGSIHSSLGNLSSIEFLKLSNNNLKFSLPSQIGQLKNLTIFEAGNNDLTGSFPSELTSLNKLQDLSLLNNNFEGSLPYFENMDFLGES